MTLFTRLSRLLRADLHAVLDRMEAPDVLLQQGIRDMQTEIDARVQLQQQRQQLQQQLYRQCGQWQDWLQQQEAELDLCFGAENDALARTLLRRKLEREQLLEQARQREQDLSRQLEQDAQVLQEQQQALESLRQQAQLYEAGRAEPEGYTDPGVGPVVTDADVELELLKAKRARSAV